MNEVILGVLSTKFAAVAGGFLSGFSMLLVAMLLLRRRVQEQLRPLWSNGGFDQRRPPGCRCAPTTVVWIWRRGRHRQGSQAAKGRQRRPVAPAECCASFLIELLTSSEGLPEHPSS